MMASACRFTQAAGARPVSGKSRVGERLYCPILYSIVRGPAVGPGVSMKGINHLVLAGHDLDALRSEYEGLGFTVTSRGQHPFGTGNSIIQLHGTYLELLSVTVPQAFPSTPPATFLSRPLIATILRATKASR